MRHLLMGVFVAALAVALSTNAEAGALSSLFADGDTINQLEDQDYESILIDDGDQFLEVGELIGGVIKIQQIVDADPGTQTTVDLQSAPDTFTALFLLRVDGSDGDNTNNNSPTTLSFGAPTQGEWDSVFGAGGVADVTSEFTPTITSEGTMAFIFDGVPSTSADEKAGSDEGSSAETFVKDARLLWEVGFTGAAGAAAAGEFWNTSGLDAEDTSLILTKTATNRFSLGVVETHAGLELLPHNFLGNTGDGNFTTSVAVQGKGTFINRTSGSEWELETDTDIYIRPVPEPSSIALLGIGVVAMAGYGLRRRKNAA